MGQVLTRHIADAYGNTSSFDSMGTALPQLPDPYSGYGAQFGYYADTETGLILCTFRYYDPNIGRWINKDPIGYVSALATMATEGWGSYEGLKETRGTNLTPPNNIYRFPLRVKE